MYALAKYLFIPAVTYICRLTFTGKPDECQQWISRRRLFMLIGDIGFERLADDS